MQSFTDAPVSECPQCGAPVRKVYGSVGVVFKGSGFYRTDSRKSASASETASSGSSSRTARRRRRRRARPPRTAVVVPGPRGLDVVRQRLPRPRTDDAGLAPPSTADARRPQPDRAPPVAGPSRAHPRGCRVSAVPAPPCTPRGGRPPSCSPASALFLAARPVPAPATARAPAAVPVAVAAADLPAGTALVGSGRRASPGCPPASCPGGVAAEPPALVGRVLAGAVRAGEPLTDARLVGPG